MFREARAGDLPGILRLYGQLNPEDPTIEDGSLEELFERIGRTIGLTLFVLEHADSIVATTYLNVIPNLTRSGSPYAIIENVVVDETLRRTGFGKRIMAGTLAAAWNAGCYKAVLATGRQDPAVHAFYRSCGLSGDEKTAFVARP